MLLVCFAASPVAGAATDIWIESSLVDVSPDSEPSGRVRDSIRLYAARGESESVQICLRAGRRDVRVEAVEAPALDDDIDAPNVYRVGYLQIDQPSPRAQRPAALWPDPLLDAVPFDVPANETRALWVTYNVSAEARAGPHKGVIVIDPGRGAKRRIPVTIEVFDFNLPDVPSLAVYFALDREAVRRMYHIPDLALEAWKPIYAAIGRGRVSFGLWSDGDLVKVAPDGSADAQAFKEHLEYAVGAAHMAAIDVGRGPNGVQPFPEPPEGVVQDPLQLYLHDIDNWLDEKGWLDRAMIRPLPVLESRDWQDARKAYFRVWRADKRVHRLLAGALHPMLERYTDIWATPTRYYQPFAQKRLEAGYSLRAEPAYPIAQIVASSSGGRGLYDFTDTDPAEACDGSLFTSWISAEPPSRDRPQWIRFDLAEMVQTTRFRIGWRPGLEPAEMRVKASIDGRVYSPADVRWEHHFMADPFDQSWSEGRFRSNKPFRSLWIEFRGSDRGGPVGITEIEFGKAPESETVERFEPLRIWTYSLDGDLPALYVDTHSAEQRLIGWMCWGHHVSGFLGGSLNSWPETWPAPSGEAPLVWSGAGPGDNFIMYPGSTGLLPSVRLERLRDGIEDYEYLKMLSSALEEKQITGGPLARWVSPRLFMFNAPPDALDEPAAAIEGARTEIAHAIAEFEQAG